MVKTNYYVAEIAVIDGSQSVSIIFKRIPTTEELKNHEIQQAKMAESSTIMMGPTTFPNMFEAVYLGGEPRKNIIKLDYSHIQMRVLLEEITKANIHIGSLVQLNIPTQICDVITNVKVEDPIPLS